MIADHFWFEPLAVIYYPVSGSDCWVTFLVSTTLCGKNPEKRNRRPKLDEIEMLQIGCQSYS